MRTTSVKRLGVASARSWLFAATIGAAMSGGTVAFAQTQVPPEMRKQAMSLAQICKADYEKLCHNVQPGGGRILQCLGDNSGKLSSACRAALPDAQALASQATSAGVMPK